jgi:ubiquinone biosynthesis protein
VVEGVGRSLDPRLDMWTTAEPVVRTWLARNLGPIGRVEQAGRAVLTLADVIADVPDLSQRLKRVLVRLDEAAPREAAKIERKLRAETLRAVWTTLGLWAIAGAVLLLALR